MYRILTEVGLDFVTEKNIVDLPLVYYRLRLSLFDQEFHDEISSMCTLSLYKHIKTSSTKEK